MSWEHLESHPGVPLRQHLEGVAQRAEAFAQATPLHLPFNIELFIKLAWLSGYYHDIAKSTPFFQDYLHKKRPKGDLTPHALPSAVVAFAAAREECKSLDESWQTLLPTFVFMAVRAHHGNLKPLIEGVTLQETNILGRQLAAIHDSLAATLPYGLQALDEARTLVTSWPLKSFKLNKELRSLPDPSFGYLVLNTLFSCLIDADKLTTTLVGKAQPSRVDLPGDLIRAYRQSYRFPEHKLNPVRDAFFNEVEDAAETVELGGCYTITAPTGIGKTLGVLNAALKLRDRIESAQGYRPRIIYALPFLSVIDQNADSLKTVIRTTLGSLPSSDLMLTHHHLSPRRYHSQDEHDFEDAAELLVEGWNSELIITTFYQVFHTLVSGRNRNVRRYHNLLGSILILDEVQSIPTKYWMLTRHLLEQITSYTPGLVLLSTATQPAILESARELLPDPALYYQHEVLQRTKIVYEPDSQDIIDLTEKVKLLLKTEVADTLVVLNTIRNARTVYTSLAIAAHNAGYDSYYLTTQVTPKERLDRIKAIKDAKKPVLIVSTQLIEAGVDIDVARVIRDASPFDSLLQVAGRANRHAERDNIAQVQVVEAVGDGFRGARVYDATLLDVTRQLLEEVAPLEEKHYLEAGQAYAQELLTRIDQSESMQHIEALNTLNYGILDGFRLIDDDAESASIFVELNDDAQELWLRYEALESIKDRWERRRSFNRFRAEFFQYVIQVRIRQTQQNLPSTVNGMLYIPYGDLETHYDSNTGFKSESETPFL